MTAAARTNLVAKAQKDRGRAAKVARAIGGAGMAVFARIAALLAPRQSVTQGYIRVTRDFGKTWEEWPPTGYGVVRDHNGHFVSC